MRPSRGDRQSLTEFNRHPVFGIRRFSRDDQQSANGSTPGCPALTDAEVQRVLAARWTRRAPTAVVTAPSCCCGAVRRRGFPPGQHHLGTGALRLPEDRVQRDGHRTDVAASETVVRAVRENRHLRAATDAKAESTTARWR